MSIYHTRTEHKLQKLNTVKENYGRLPEATCHFLAAYANQTKLYNIICNNNKGQKHILTDANIQNNLQRRQYSV